MSRLQITVDDPDFEVQVQADGNGIPSSLQYWVDGVMVPVVAPLADEHTVGWNGR